MKSHRLTPIFVALVLGALAPATPVLAGRVTNAASLVRQGWAAMDAGRLEDAAMLMEQAAAAQPSFAARCHLNAACLLARAGREAPALDAVEAAVTAGWRDRSEVEGDPDLAPLTTDSRWRPLLARVDANAAAFRARHADPDSARFLTGDLRRLAALLPLPAADDELPEAVRLLAESYFDAGSDGLADFLALRKIRDVETEAVTVAHLPRLYAGMDTLADAITAREPELRAALRGLRDLAPEAWFPDVTFVAGHFRSGGTSTEHGLVIGAEIFGLGSGVDYGEFPAEARGMLRPIAELDFVVVHELVHFQQLPSPADHTLLRAALVEGSADYLAQLVLPDTPEPDYRAWGRAHDAEVKERFLLEMAGTDTSAWIANNDRATPEWPAALGYYVGYRIAEGYVNRAADRRGAVRALLELRDPEDLLQRSGWLESR